MTTTLEPLGRRMAHYRLGRRLLGALLRRRRRALCDRLAAEHGCTVLSGPFRGMAYLPDMAPAATPRLLGTYEEELHPVIAEITARGYAHIVNVGCAEGYYAVGLARLLPDSRIWAFDESRQARDRCARLAGLNGVADRILVSGRCTVNALRALPLVASLIVCDIDGGELALLNPDDVPALGMADLLVELHELIVPGVTRALADRFGPTHDLTYIASLDRDPDAYPWLKEFPPAKRRLAVAEFRDGPMQWAYMRAKARDLCR